MNESEVWKEVPSVPGLAVSSEGRVIVLPRVEPHQGNGGLRYFVGKPRVGVWNGDRFIFFWRVTRKTYKVHRLVCEAFNGPAPDGKNICMHLDEDARNNKPENLRWGTSRENANFPKFIAYRKTLVGEKSTMRIARERQITTHALSKVRHGPPRET